MNVTEAGGACWAGKMAEWPNVQGMSTGLQWLYFHSSIVTAR